MSGRAAWRLESLGFGEVYRYTAGKNDWFANGLPREGMLTAFPTAASAVRPDVPTCLPDEPIDTVRGRIGDWEMCVVVNEHGVVLGVLRRKALEGAVTATAEQAMEAGPTTFRPNELLAELTMRLTRAGVERVLITDSDGRLIGALDCDDAARLTGAGGVVDP
jgi:signal-transduction protein with cAMP-binding, CBS, and nucleotidyltransferase domain